jgi:hypothetical protein
LDGSIDCADAACTPPVSTHAEPWGLAFVALALLSAAALAMRTRAGIRAG